VKERPGHVDQRELARVLRERWGLAAAAGGGPAVITHGEPHPGNIMRSGGPAGQTP
jgi:hypothetical protein